MASIDWPSCVDPVQLKASLPTPVASELLSSLRGKISAVPNLSLVEQRWLDDACLERYIRARKMNVEKAYLMLVESIKWRREFDIEELMKGDLSVIKKESETGKLYVRGHDRAGRPILYMKPRLQNSKNVKANIRQLVYTLERAAGEVVPPQAKLVMILDFKGYSLQNAPSIKTMRETLTILQNHYPERLHRAILVEAPTIFFGAYRIIKPFVDPVTTGKIHFLERTKGFAEGSKALAYMQENFDLSEVEKAYGGTSNYVYSNESYFETRYIPAYLA